MSLLVSHIDKTWTWLLLFSVECLVFITELLYFEFELKTIIYLYIHICVYIVSCLCVDACVCSVFEWTFLLSFLVLLLVYLIYCCFQTFTDNKKIGGLNPLIFYKQSKNFLKIYSGLKHLKSTYFMQHRLQFSVHEVSKSP